MPKGKQLPFAPKRSHHQISKADTENITTRHPTYKQEKDKIPNTKETSTPNTESATKITQT